MELLIQLLLAFTPFICLVVGEGWTRDKGVNRGIPDEIVCPVLAKPDKFRVSGPFCVGTHCLEHLEIDVFIPGEDIDQGLVRPNSGGRFPPFLKPVPAVLQASGQFVNCGRSL